MYYKFLICIFLFLGLDVPQVNAVMLIMDKRASGPAVGLDATAGLAAYQLHSVRVSVVSLEEATARERFYCTPEAMKADQEKVVRHAEMIEGSEAFERVRNAMITILSVPKSALPPSPYKQSKPTKKRPTAHKG